MKREEIKLKHIRAKEEREVRKLEWDHQSKMPKPKY